MLSLIAIIIIVHWARKTTRDEEVCERWDKMFKN